MCVKQLELWTGRCTSSTCAVLWRWLLHSLCLTCSSCRNHLASQFATTALSGMPRLHAAGGQGGTGGQHKLALEPGRQESTACSALPPLPASRPEHTNPQFNNMAYLERFRPLRAAAALRPETRAWIHLPIAYTAAEPQVMLNQSIAQAHTHASAAPTAAWLPGTCSARGGCLGCVQTVLNCGEGLFEALGEFLLSQIMLPRFCE